MEKSVRGPVQLFSDVSSEVPPGFPGGRVEKSADVQVLSLRKRQVAKEAHLGTVRTQTALQAPLWDGTPRGPALSH